MPLDVRQSPETRTSYGKSGWQIEDTYTVVGTTDRHTALNAQGDNGVNIPEYNEAYPDARFQRLKVSDKDAVRKGNSLDYWEVRVSYTVPVGDRHEEQEEDPLDETPTISWDKGFTQEQVWQDVNGNAITNSAGDTPSTPIVREFITRRFTVSRRDRFYEAALADPYENKWNSSQCTIRGAGTFAAGTLRCLHITPPGKYPVDAEYTTVDYHFEVRVWFKPGAAKTVANIRQGQYIWIKDQGFRGYANIGGTNKIGRIVTKEGEEPVVTEVPLNGFGAPKSSANYQIEQGTADAKTYHDGTNLTSSPNGAEVETAGTAVLLRWQNAETANLNALGLG